MPIGIGTSPALVKNEGNATTAQFSPPANSLLVASVTAFSDLATPSLSSGGGLTWTRRIQRATGDDYYNEIWTAPAAGGATNITATYTINSSFPFAAIKVDVVSGALLAAPAGQSGTGATTTNNATVNGYTSSMGGSRGFISALCPGTTVAPTSTDDESAWPDDNGGAGLMARKAANTPSSGTVVTFNLDAAGTGAVDWRWAALEILPFDEGRAVSILQTLTAVHHAATW
ncbi:hypothetical protein ACIBEJ_48640 [Nonomuraea sp. NPDC050790]|uniref:hypothetical protein n=1 Tax=Nonomuraea sp. NPDC050790 TaxID=3364371 RepID=UPI003792ED7D